MKKQIRYSPEVWERAIWLVHEHQNEGLLRNKQPRGKTTGY